ncbi:hypothetical protein [Methylobrevis pamukkalensis]|uniref:Uncharacterized protein n=1 Tax=Methylobrevis pamukkalensis TaxID=1439726 RepID=A0A1E3H0D8_9HYPH|nr:hypothetical protein [Methylobrevis pamukkalensis]ODN69779.1 hypothetical protein A6302_02901 [Methylobrevis pamukkalensis]
MARYRSEDRYRSNKPVRRIIVTKGDEVRSYVVRPWVAGSLALVGALFAAVYLAPPPISCSATG